MFVHVECAPCVAAVEYLELLLTLCGTGGCGIFRLLF